MKALEGHRPLSSLAIGLAWVGAMLSSACVAPQKEEEETGVAQSAVVLGMPVTSGEYAATGWLVHPETGAPKFVCTGTLIGERAVLTAAHCVVLIGSVVPDFSLAIDVEKALPQSVFRGLAVHLHPDFAIVARDDEALHDLAIVELAEPVEDVAPEALPTEEEAASPIVAGTQVDLVGYGATSPDGTGMGIKNAGVAEIVELAPTEMTIGAPMQVRNCLGDSGGPSLLDGSPPPRARLVGVVSRSVDDAAPCAGGAIHTRIAPHLPWIEEVVTQIERGEKPAPSGCSLIRNETIGPHAEVWPLIALVLAAVAIARRGRTRSRSPL